MRLRRPAALAATALLVPGLVVPAATAAPAPTVAAAGWGTPRPGAPGAGDPYFPYAGNGGYDVRHYDLGIRYQPATRDFRGVARISARATKALSRFDLDLRGFTVSSVVVDGRRARWTRSGQELRITPARWLRRGERFTVVVRYAGRTGRPVDNTGVLYGWVSTPDGSFVANEPEGASTWYPVNDVPTDKATYDITVTVPRGKTAVANGELRWSRTRGAWTTYAWRARDPMASYLSTASIGDYRLRYGRAAGVRTIDAIDRDLGPEADDGLARTGQMMAFFSRLFGRYPFTSYGAIVDDDEDAGYALETQTRPVYSGPPDESTVAHELAHQWYGNSVTLERWRDIWLNEGFATYAEWLWAERTGGPSPAQEFARLYALPPTSTLWRPPVGDPGATGLFDRSVYQKGAMTLQALRQRIGDRAFFATLRAWAGRYRYDNASTADFVRLAERISGRQLDRLFRVWLYEEGKPTSW